MSRTKITIFSDGGARGNPGPAAAAFAAEIRSTKHEIRNFKKAIFIGTATNNQAEYRAVIEALKWIKEKHLSNRFTSTSEVVAGKVEDLEIECFLDSELIVEQLNQRYKLKNKGLKPLFWQVRDLVLELGGKVQFKYIPREKNHQADKLVNEAIDKVVK